MGIVVQMSGGWSFHSEFQLYQRCAVLMNATNRSIDIINFCGCVSKRLLSDIAVFSMEIFCAFDEICLVFVI